MKAPVQLVLPLLDETARADDETAFQIAAGDQLLDEESRHDRLAGARIVREQKAQRLAREHRFIDGSDLMRERVHQRGVDREYGIEEMREMDTIRLSDQAKETSVAIEAPWAAHLRDFEARLVVPVENFVGYVAVGTAIHEGHGVRAVPFYTHNSGE